MPGGYTESSDNIHLEGSVLVANCKRNDGSIVESQLDLNDWVVNIDGALGWQKGGNFSATCRNLSIEWGGKFLACDATTFDGDSVPYRLDINERVTNRDGQLVIE